MGKKEFIKYIDKKSIDRIRFKITILNGEVVDVVVQYEAFISEKWCALVRYDCAHGFFHRDLMFPNGDKDKQVIEFDKLETALTYAEQDLKDRWGFYRSRYIKLIKS